MKTYALIRADGSMAVMRLFDTASDPYKEMDKWTPEQRAEFVEVREIDPNDIPKDRSQRNDWKITDSSFSRATRPVVRE